LNRLIWPAIRLAQQRFEGVIFRSCNSSNKTRLKRFQKKYKIPVKTLKPHKLYKFGLFSLDATAKVLLKGEQPVPITRKAIETLLVLVENAGQVVPKEEMFKAIWPDRVVDEANLTQNIAMVRRALGAERGSPAYIETFPGRGYRLLGPVLTETHEMTPGSPANGDNSTVETHSNGEKENSSENESSMASVEASAEKAFSFNPTAAEKPIAGKRSLWIRLWPVVSAALAFAAVGWIWAQRNTGTSEAEFRVAPWTRLPGKERQPALSPDGKKVAFQWDLGEGRRPEIRVQVLGENSPRQITRQEGHYSSPSWSPDGSALAFLRIGKEATEVLIISLETGNERLISSFTPPNYGLQHRLLDWSPNGQWLVVSHSESPNKPNGLYLVSVATGEKRPLTNPEPMVGGDIDPHFSPDSQSVTFIRDIHRSHQEIYSISISGGPVKQLTADAKQISSHDWIAGGQQIVFASDRGGEFRLWKMRANAGSPEKNPQPLGIYAEFPMELSLARKSDSLAYSVEHQDRKIWRLDLKDKKWTRNNDSSAQDASPQYSPAGDKICFRSDRTGEEQLWVSDINGNDQVQVTTGAQFPSVGHWSPDGRQIVFNNARTGEMFLASLSSDQKWSVRNLEINGVHPVFSPDGKWIYAGTTGSIFRIPAGGGEVSEIARTGGFSLGVSGDGHYVYFMREVNDTVLWKIHTGTGELSKALDGLVQRCTSCWSLAPDGIYFLGSSRDSFDSQMIYFHDFSTGRQREVIKYPEPISPIGSGPFSLSPDLSNLLCVRVDPSNSDILRVEPFR